MTPLRGLFEVFHDGDLPTLDGNDSCRGRRRIQDGIAGRLETLSAV
jgi:hypothetical protein